MSGASQVHPQNCKSSGDEMLRKNRRVKKGSSNIRHENKTFAAKMTSFIWIGETGYTKKENCTNKFLLRSLKPPIKCWEKPPSSLFDPHIAHAIV